jgi:hypothetical protein
MVAQSRPGRSYDEHTTRVDPGYVAFWLLRGGFVVLPVFVGVDKFFDWMVDWRLYLWSGVPNTLHVSATSFMHIAGVIEIVAGILVLVAPQVGGALVAAWLGGIVTNLVLVGIDEHMYWDVALRDFGLMIGALALVALATRYQPIVRKRSSHPLSLQD